LSWSPGSGSTSSDVYFGTDSTPDSGELQGNQTATTFEPGTMSNNTTYYWRIDEINAGGTTTGDVWSFTTTSGASPPGQASSPSPANSATDVNVTTDLSWTAGTGSTSSDVYFGTSSPGTSQGNQTATTFDTGTMDANTTYYWRIDEINASGTTTGTVWSFTTESTTTVGNTTILGSSTTTANRRAVPYTMPADGTIQSVTMYHTGGSDDMILGVYTGESLPGDRIAVTAQTAVSGSTGWQTIDLTSPVFVESGTKIWLAWVYESNPGIYYEVSTPGRAHSDDTWSGGMPNPFGSSTLSNYIYSIYATYTPGGGTPPGQASNPSPANSATNVSITADLSWTEGTDSTSSDVYFGTSSPGAFQGNQAATTFDTGTMSNNTTYYWRIDEVNAGGTTTGTVWSFTTIVAAPGQASSPSPSNSATGVSITADLSWSPGSGSTSSDVYFGTDSTPDSGELQGNQTATTFEPGTMSNNTTYYWRIDEINAGGTTTGTVWSFTTIVAAPGAASSPGPANSATDVSVTADLSWTEGSGATSHDVYFGTSSPGASQGNQTATTFDTGTMNNDTTYYWRIDEINASGTTTGSVWSFTTTTESATTVGNTTVFGDSVTTANRRAMPYTMPADGIIESVAMYHVGGSDDMILGVYTGESLPGERVAVTATTPVSGSTGWQTIDLTTSVFVESGTTIWLAWVYESNPGIYCEDGTPGRAHSDDTWSAGMPDPFESSTQSAYIYSIYANYTPTVTEEFGDAADTNYPGTIGDTYTNVGSDGDDNWSTDTTLNTYTWPADVIANTTIIKWDLTDIPTDATVVEATLYLYQVDSDVDSSYDIGVHKITGVNPGITTCTWNTYDGTNSWTGGADGGQSDIAAAEDTQVVNLTDDEYKTWDVTDMVADWVATPANNYGMLINSDDDATIDSYRFFASTEDNDSSVRPKLIVTYSD